MKFVFAVLLLAGLAFAEPEATPEATPEAEAEAWYGRYYGHGYGYGGYGYGHRYYGGYYGHPYGYGYYRGKRDAEADPAVLASTSALTAPQALSYGLHHPYAYGYGLPYAGHHAIPHAYTVSAPTVATTVPAVTYTHPVVHHAGVYGHPSYYGGYLPKRGVYGGLYSYGLPIVKAAEVERKKRDAEAEPEAEPEADAEAAADAWYGYYGHPSYYGGWGRRYGYGGWGGYYGHGYGHGYGYGYGWGK